MKSQYDIVSDVLLESPMVRREQIMSTIRTPAVCHARYAAARLMLDAGYSRMEVVTFFDRDRTWTDQMSTHKKVVRTVWLVKRRWEERAQRQPASAALCGRGVVATLQTPRDLVKSRQWTG